MHIALGVEDLTKVRFQVSPLWETVTSIKALQKGTPVHRPWIEMVKERIAASTDPRAQEHLTVLTALVLPTGYIADSLTPTQQRQDSFAESLEAIRAVPREFWERDLHHLADLTAGRPSHRTIYELLSDIDAAISRILAALEWYWAAAVEPFWPRLRSVLLADIDTRLEQLARDGIQEVFKTLHPSVRPTSTGLEIMRGCCYSASSIPDPGRGLVLVPNVFVWPDTLVLNVQPFVPTITYAPRGVGRLWETVRETSESPVSALLGRTRAQILAQLDVPMTTTQLACALDLAAGTVSGHLRVLSGSGLAESLRSGREVFYRRGELGEALLSRA
ncbi:DNA-binding transcriptional ArsR family regulator [Arthrobacter pascens]|uniref:ArsR/SmtB family transcription factor n=1 Tax=Arthrobacter pascens TaxID=1677 RepID=UPI002780521F|nr:DUF5937 family protein [Arthrobacter pascens]MDQ0632794.1 DNA-binding transcriptional ArsR family regulator [Arthrobacter pascens]